MRLGSAERVYRHRERRAAGLRTILIDVRDDEIKALVARGYLREDAKKDVDQIGRALELLLDRVLR